MCSFWFLHICFPAIFCFCLQIFYFGELADSAITTSADLKARRLIKIPKIPNSRTLSIKSGFRGTGQYHYQKIEDVQSSANKKTNDGEKFYDFDDEENNGAAVASSSTLNEQKRNGKLTMVRREHLNNDSIPAAKFGKDAEATSSGSASMTASSGGASGLAAASLTSLTDLITDWKSAKEEQEEEEEGESRKTNRVRRQAQSAERGLGPFVARHIKTVLRHLETVILHLEDLLRDMKYVD